VGQPGALAIEEDQEAETRDMTLDPIINKRLYQQVAERIPCVT
jgi:hypothetical protein